MFPAPQVVVDTTKVRFFKQITTQKQEFVQHLPVVVDTTKVRFFKQITTVRLWLYWKQCCCWYHKGTIFQANHNASSNCSSIMPVVVDTTKVRFFKQITTAIFHCNYLFWLLLIPQRYDFSSKSQRSLRSIMQLTSCCWYHKGTIFQAKSQACVRVNIVIFKLKNRQQSVKGNRRGLE